MVDGHRELKHFKQNCNSQIEQSIEARRELITFLTGDLLTAHFRLTTVSPTSVGGGKVTTGKGAPESATYAPTHLPGG